MTQPLPQKIADSLPPDNELIVGTVTAVVPLTVAVRGGTILNPGTVGSYIPAVGDPVQMLRQEATWLILGSSVSGQDATLTVSGFSDDTAAAVTTSVNYTNINPVRFQFVKRLQSTRVRVDLSVSFFSTAVNTKAQFGVDFVGGPRFDLVSMLANVASDHKSIGCNVVLPGVAAGTWTMQLIWLRASGAGTLTINTDDWVSILASEVA